MGVGRVRPGDGRFPDGGSRRLSLWRSEPNGQRAGRRGVGSVGAEGGGAPMTGSRRSRGRCWRSRRPNRGTGGGDGGMDVGQSSTRSRPRRGDLLASLNSESSARATTGGDAGGRGRTRACDISTSTVESATRACVGVSPDAAAVSSTSTEHDAPRCGAGMRGIGWCSRSRRAKKPESAASQATTTRPPRC